MEQYKTNTIILPVNYNNQITFLLSFFSIYSLLSPFLSKEQHGSSDSF